MKYYFLLFVLLSLSDVFGQKDKKYVVSNDWITIKKWPVETIRPSIIWIVPNDTKKVHDIVEPTKVISFTLVFAKPFKLKIDDIHVLIKNEVAKCMIDIEPKNDREYRLTTSIDVPYDLSTLKIVFQHTTNKTESESISIRRIPPDLYLFTAGIKSNLNFSGKDARDMDTLFKGQKDKFYRDVKTANYTTESETEADKLTKSFAKFVRQLEGKLRPQNDLMIVFLSGHGNHFIFNGQDDFGILGSDYDTELPDKTSIYFIRDILTELNKINCKKIIFLDACHSEPPNMIAAKSEYFNDLAQAYEAFSKASPTTITIVSSSKTQPSHEDSYWKNGAFTYVIKEGLSQGKADKNDDGFIKVRELFEYIKNKVPQAVKAVKGNNILQQPLIRPENTESFDDFVIYKWK